MPTHTVPNRTEARFSRGEYIAVVSVVVMVLLTILKISVALFSGSISLLADGVNSFSDILASALVWSGLRLLSRSADEKFPYGYYRGETIATLIVSIFIIITGIGIIIDALLSLMNPVPIADATFPVLTALLSAIVYLSLARYKRRIGNEIGSNALIADSIHSMVDVYSSLIVFVGIILSFSGIPVIEVLIALGIGVYIIIEGVQLARDASFNLMDAAQDPKLIAEIERIASAVTGVREVHEIRLRRSGPVCFAEMHVLVDSHMSVEDAHKLTEVIESNLMEEMTTLEGISTHIEPAEKSRLMIGVPIDRKDGQASNLSQHFAKSRYIAVFEIIESNVTEIRFVDNPGFHADSRKGILAADLLTKVGVDAVVVTEIGLGPFAVLKANRVKVYRIPIEKPNIADVAEMIVEDKLILIDEPE